MKRLIVSLLALSALSSSVCSAEEDLAGCKSVYERESSKIETTHEKRLQGILSAYETNLKAIKEQLKKTGDLEGVLACRKEQDRFRKEKSVPQKPPASLPEVIRRAQSLYHQTAANARVDMVRECKTLASNYLGRLAPMKKALVFREKLDEAIAVDSEIKRVKFIIADIESGVMRPRPAPINPQPAEDTGPAVGKSDYWVGAMKAVHAGFRGDAGYVAQFGDSITYSMAFWSPIGWDDPEGYLTGNDSLPKKPANRRWRDTLKGFRDKGPKHGSYSGWKVGNVLKVIDGILKQKRPGMAIIMLGTNDIAAGKVPESYKPGLEEIVKKCLAAHCIPILNTIPPRRGRQDAVQAANTVVREVAQQYKVPLVDYYEACLKLRPGNSWDGTVISDDGVHPTGGKNNRYSEDNMKICGYALRNWVNFLAVREVYFRVVAP